MAEYKINVGGFTISTGSLPYPFTLPSVSDLGVPKDHYKPTSAQVVNAGGGGEKAITTTGGRERGLSKWVQKYLTPDMFATPESCLIGWGKPTLGMNNIGTEFNLIGLCENLTINTSNSVMAIKEFRNERNIIVPIKSNPGSITITRLLTAIPNLQGTVGGDTKWRMNNQAYSAKNLFGLAIIFMSPTRDSTFSAVYAERCAITGQSVAMQGGQFQMYESVSITFDRLVDDIALGGAGSEAADGNGA